MTVGNFNVMIFSKDCTTGSMASIDVVRVKEVVDAADD